MDTKTFQPSDLLAQLLGNNTTTSNTQTGTADTSALQGVYGKAMAPMDQQLYNNLISSIFQKASENVPGITQALANATGSRSTGNSPLALALNEQNNNAARDAASAILAQQNTQLNTAQQAATGIAQATKGTTTQQTVKQGTAIDPLTALLGGTALNWADKKGIFDKMGNAGSTAFDNIFNSEPAVNYNSGPANISKVLQDFTGGSGGGGADTSFSTFDTPSLSDVGSYIGTMGSAGAGAAGDWMDNIGSAASGAWDTVKDWGSSIGDYFGFADGGYLPYDHPHMRMYMNNNNSSMLDPMVGEFNRYADGGILGRMDRRLHIREPRNMYADGGRMMHRPAMHCADGGLMNLPPMRQMPMRRPQQLDTSMIDPMTGMPTYYADGGTMRNRNYMGAPLARYGVNAMEAQTPFDGMGTGGGNQGASSQAAADMIQRILSDYQVSNGGNSTGVSAEKSPLSLTGVLNADMGDPQGKALGAKAASAAAGMVNPLLGMLVAMSQGESPTSGGLGGLAKAVASTVYRNKKASDALNDSTDPLGSFVAALSQTGKEDAPSFDGSQAAPDVMQKAQEALSLVSDNKLPGLAPASPSAADQAASDNAANLVNTVNQFSTSGGGNYKGTPAGNMSGTQGDGGDSTTGPSGGSLAADGGLSKGFGLIKGRGTGTSDSLLARSKEPGSPDIHLSTDEGIIPADVIQAVGWDHFQALIDAFHTPVRR
jgi:hypothetical protein